MASQNEPSVEDGSTTETETEDERYCVFMKSDQEQAQEEANDVFAASDAPLGDAPQAAENHTQPQTASPSPSSPPATPEGQWMHFYGQFKHSLHGLTGMLKALELYDQQVLAELMAPPTKHCTIRAYFGVFLAYLERTVAWWRVQVPSAKRKRKQRDQKPRSPPTLEVFQKLQALVQRARSQVQDWSDTDAIEMQGCVRNA